MPDSLAERASRGVSAARKSLIAEQGCEALQLDYELKLVLFLTARIDGEINHAEKQYTAAVGRLIFVPSPS